MLDRQECMHISSVVTTVGLGPYCVVRFDEADCVPAYHLSYSDAYHEANRLKVEGIRAAVYAVEYVTDVGVR